MQEIFKHKKFMPRNTYKKMKPQMVFACSFFDFNQLQNTYINQYF